MSDLRYAINPENEIGATFASPDQLEDAINRLTMAGFDRADISLPEALPPAERATPESSAAEANTDHDARQARTVHTSTAAAAAALAAAGITAATGGAAVPVAIAAVLAGGVVGGGTYAISTAANDQEQREREARATAGALILAVRAPTREKRETAGAILRAAGGTDCSST